MMSTGPQSRALDSIVVPAIPFLEGNGRIVAIFVVPLEHLGLEVNTRLLAVETDGLLGVIEKIISVDDNEVVLIDDVLLDQEIKETHELLITGLIGHEVIKTSDFIQRRHRATVV